MLYQTRAGSPATFVRVRPEGNTEWHIHFRDMPKHRPILGIRDAQGRAAGKARDLDIVPVTANDRELAAMANLFDVFTCTPPDELRQAFILWLRRQQQK